MKLNAKELRTSEPTEADLAKIRRREIYIICDNILDTYNTGSIFRLADAVAAKKVFLCGETVKPPFHRISKAAVGTEKWVPWEYKKTTLAAIKRVKNLESRIKVYAIEQHEKSIDYRKADLSEPVCFVLGHETRGVSHEVMKASDGILEIPMHGVNKSLNVMVSLAIVLFSV